MSETNLPQRPVLQPWRDYAVTPDRVILRYAEGAVVFEGRASITLLPELMSRLDGSRSVDELVAELGESAGPAIRQALEQLHERGLLAEGDADAGTGEAVRRTSRALAEVAVGDLTFEQIAGHVATARVAVIGDGSLARAISDALTGSGVGTVHPVAERDALASLSEELGEARDLIVVVAPSTPYARVLTDVNRWALREEHDWMQVLPYDGHRAVVGPVYAPTQTGCYHCFRLRRRAAVDFHQESVDLDAAADADAVHRGGEWRAHPQDLVVAGQAAYFALWQTLPAENTVLPLLGRAVALGWTMVGPTIEDHTLLRVPRCRECSRGRDTGVPQPWFAPSPEAGETAPTEDAAPAEHLVTDHAGPAASERQAARVEQGAGVHG